MKIHYIKLLFGILFTLVISQKVKAQFTISGSNGCNGNYTSLTNAAGVFATLNAGASQAGYNVVVTVTASSTGELRTNTLTCTTFTTLTMYPTGSGYTISGSYNGSLLKFDGCDNITINGSVNQGNATPNLTITNTSTGGSATTIEFLNTAENNTVKYCTVRGAGTGTTGVIYFASATSGNGNSSNTIDHNNLTSVDASNRPYYVVNSNGSATYLNTGNTISNNNIYDFFRDGGNSTGINLESGGTNTISGNSFYETTTLTTLGAYSYKCINSGSSATTPNNTITGNYFGGNAASCSGTFTVNGTSTPVIHVIHIATGSASIQGNTIKNISWTINNTAVLVNRLINLAHSSGNTVDVGTTTANTIGDNSTGSIIFTNNAVVSSINVNTLYAITSTGTGTTNIQNNRIGSITCVGSSTFGYIFYGISSTGSSTTDISSNVIGHETTVNSINATQTSTSSDQHLTAINLGGSSSTFNINGNTIANLTNACTRNGTSSALIGIRGIISSLTGGTNTITNNIIHDFNAAGASSNTSSAVGYATYACVGISNGTTTAAKSHTITGNTIYNLYVTSTGVNTRVCGIHFDGATGVTHTINKNFIYGLSNTGTNTGVAAYGIFLKTGGTTTVSNNIIAYGSAITTSTPAVYGIYDESGTNSLYFNTIYLNGTTTTGSANSCGIFSLSTNTKNYRNNISVNARINSGATGKHYAMYITSTTGLTIDYNDYYVSGSGGVLGYCGADRADIAAVRTGTSQDASSVSTNPSFASAGGTTAVNYLPSSLTTGVAGTGISDDYASTSRSAPKMGAYESTPVVSYYWVGGAGNWSSYATHWATTSGGSTFNTSAPTSADNVYFDAASGSVTVTVDATANAKNITCTGFTGTLAGSSALNCYGDLILVSGMTNSYTGTITMAATSGTNTITSGTKTIANLTINGTGGTFTPSDNTTVSGTFTMTAGTYNVGNAASALTTQVATFSQTGGTFNIAGSSATANQILTVTGNFTLATAGTFDLNAQAGAYSGRLNVAGNFTHSGTTFQATRSSLTYCLVYLNGTSGTQTLESTGQTGTIAWSVGASNAQCNIASTKSFTLAAAASFVVGAGTSTPDLLIDGTFVNSSAVAFTMTGTGQVSATGTYQHAVNSGTIPTLTWSTGSLCNVTGITTTVCSGLGQSFYNLIWNCASQTSTVAMNASPTVNNDFTITTTNSAGGGILVLSSSATQTMTVGGNFTMTAGKFYLNTSTSTGPVMTFTVTGSTTINGGTFYLDNSGSSGPLTVTYTTGDFTLASGTTFDCGAYNTVNVNFKGSVTNTGTGIFRSTSAAPTINFSGTGSTQIYNNSSSGYASANLSVWNIGTGASSPTVVQLGSNLVTEQDAADNSQEIVTVWGTLIFGTGSTNGTNSFYVDVNTGFNGTFATDKFEVKTDGVLKITSTDGIVLSKTLGNVRQYYADASHIVMGAGAFYHYVGVAAQSTGTALPTTISGGLIINNTSGSATGVSLSQATTISGTLTLTNGLFTTTSVLIPSITNTINTAVSGGSTTSFVNGPMKWTLANSLGGSYSFPLGKATITYSPFGLASVTGTSPVITAEVFAGDNGGSADAATISSLSTSEYWVVSNTGTYTTGSVSLGRTAIGSATQIGRGTNAGVYYGLNGTVSGNSVITSDLTGSTLGYFRLGGDASGYWWNGASTVANPAAGGTGTWGVANGWRYSTSTGTAGVYGVSGASYAFLAGTAGTVTLDANYSPTGTYIKTTGYTLATTGAARTLAGLIGMSSYNLTLAPTSTSSADLVLSGIISGSGLLTHNGTGKTTLSGANTNSGGVTLTAGTLYLNHATSLGTGTFTIASGTTLDGGAITISPAVAQTWNGSFNFTGTNSLNLGTGAVTLGASTTITAAHATNTLTIGGIIDDGASTYNLATAGTAGAIILSGANTYGGTTTVGTGSKLQLGAAGVIPDASALTVTGTFDMASYSETVGSITGVGTIDNTSGVGTYTLTNGGDASSTTFSGTIQNTTGTVALTKSGAGTLTLSGTNTFKGAVTISAGGISVNTLANSSSNSALGTGATTSAISMAASTTLTYTGSGHSSNRAITLTGTGVTIDASGSGTMDLSGGVTGNTYGLVLTGTGNGSQSGVIGTTSGTITKTGTGTWTLSNTANTYTGATTVNAGTLSFSTVANGSSNSGIGAATTTATNLVLGGGTLQYTGVTASTNRAFALTAATTSTIDVSTNTLTISGASGNSTTGALIKAGAGTLALTGSNTFSGAVTINAGTLSVNTLQNAGTNSSLGTGSTTAAITIAGGATLAYTGSGHSTSRAIVLSSTGGIIDASGSGTMTLSAGVTGNTFGLVLTGTGNGAQSGVIGTTTGGVTKTGAGTWTLSNTANTYTGVTTVNAGTLSFSTVANGGSNSGIGAATTTATNLVLGGGTLQYTGVTASTNRAFALTTGTTSSIDVSTNTLTISGASGNSTNGALTKAGAGTLILSGTNTWTGNTTVSAGTLTLGASGVIADASNMVLSGGTFSTGATSGYSETVGTLSMTSSSTITLGSGSHSLNFAASTSSGWTGTLTITGWTGSYDGTTGTAGKIYFGSNTSGLSSATPSISTVRFYNGTTYFPGILLSTGELVPTTNTFYSKSSSTPSTASNWNTATDGTGTDAVAADFTGGHIFKVQNGHTMTTTANLTISGTNAKLQILNGGTFISASGSTIIMGATATLQIDDGGTYKKQNAQAYATTELAGIESFGPLSYYEVNGTPGTLGTLSSYGYLKFNFTTTDPGACNYSTSITSCSGLTVGSTASNFTLSGTNTFTGGVTLLGGVLKIGNTSALGAVGGTFTISGGTFDNVIGSAQTMAVNNPQSWGGNYAFTGTNDLNMGTGAIAMTANTQVTVNGSILTEGGIISGAYTLSKAGTGTLRLNGVNTHSAGTTLSAGTLQIGSTSALGAVGSTFTISGGTFDNLIGSAQTMAVNNPQSWGGNYTFTGTNDLNMGTGAVAMTASTQVTVNGSVLTEGGIISGAYTLTKAGTGTLTLTGANTYSVATVISAGTLIAQTNAAALGSGTLTLSGGTLSMTNTSGTGVSFNRNTTVSSSSSITSDVLASGAGNTHTLGTLAINASTLTIAKGSNVTSGTAGVTFGTTTLSASTATFSVGVDCNLTLGALTGAFIVAKSGVGKLTLGTTSARTTTAGTTTLTAGTLRLNVAGALNTHATAAFALNGGTLSLGVDAGATYTSTALTVGGTATIESDRTTSGAGVIQTLGTLSIGNYTLSFTKGSYVTSGTAETILGNTTLTASTATFDVATGVQVTLGAVGGAFVMAKSGAGTLKLATTSTRVTTAGTTTLTAGKLRLEVANALNTNGGGAAALALNGGTLSLGVTAGATYGGTAITVGGAATIESDRLTSGAGATQTVGTLSIGNSTLSVTAGSNVTSGTAQITTGAVTLTSTPTFTVTNSVGSTTELSLAAVAGSTFLSTINGDGDVSQTGVWSGSGGLTYSGTGTLTLSQANSYTGVTTISSGTLILGAAAVLANTSTMSLGGGTFKTGATTGYSETLGALSMTASSTITLGSGVHSLNFAASTSSGWTGTLTITGWTGAYDGTSGTAGKIYFGTNTSGLTSATPSISTVRFYNGSTYFPGILLATGELVPTTNTFYSKGSLTPSAATSWNTATDGSGTDAVAGDFTAGNVFQVQSGHTMTTTAAWSVSGTNSKVQVLSGGVLVAASTFPITVAAATTFQIDNGGTYKHQNTSAYATTILQGTESFGATSTFETNATATTLPTNASYGNMIVNYTTDPGAVDYSTAITSCSGITITAAPTSFKLSGTNTFTGGVTLTSGTLQIGNTSALGAVGGTFVLNGGIFDNSIGSTQTMAVNNPQTWGGNFTFTGTNSLNMGTGAVSLTGTRTATISANTLTIGGIMSGGFGLTKAGSGTLTLTGTNTFTGVTTVNAGVLSVGTIGNGGVAGNLGQASTTATNIVLGGGTLQYTGATASTDRAFALTGATTSTIDVTTNTLTISGASGNSTSGALTKIGSGTLVLSGANNYTGLTTITAGVLNLQNATASGTVAGGITVANGTALQLQGAITVGAEALSLTGTGVSTDGSLRNISGNNSYAGVVTLATAARINSDANTLTLTGGITATNINLSIGGAGNTTISTTGITTGSGTLTKDGAGTLTLSASSTYTGTTTITAGTVVLGAGNILSNSTNMSLGGGTFSTGATTGYAETVGTLTMTASSTINLGSGSHALNFSASTNSAWVGTLTIVGWTGSWDGTTGTAGKIYFGNSAAGLDNTAPTVSEIRFFDGVDYFKAVLLATGELVPTPTATVFYSKSSGNLDVTTNWGSVSDGTGSNPSNFTANGQTFNLVNNATPTIGANWVVSGTGSKIVVGDGSGAINFTVPAAYTFTGTVDVSNLATLTVMNTTVPTIGTLGATSTVIYNGTSSQSVTAGAYYNLTLNNSAGGVLAGTSSVSGTLTLTDGTLTVGAYTLTVSGSTVARTSGNINASNASALISFTNTGAITLPASTFTGNVNTLTLNGTGGVTLGSSITVASTLTLTAGTLTLGANTLTLANNSAPVRTSGNINATNAAAEVSFTNTSSITLPTSLFSGSISKLKMNGVGGVTLPENTTISGTLTLTSGLLSVTGGTTLTLGTTSTNATISGGSGSSYIIAYDSGTIGSVKSYVNSNAAYSFPIGDATNYTPLTFTLVSNGGLASAYLTAYTKPSKFSSINSSFTTYLNRYWEFSQSGMTTPSYNLTMTYVAGDVVGTESTLLPVKKSGSTWYKPSGSTFTNGTTQGTGSVDVVTHTLTWNTLTTFSTGTGVGTMAVGLPIELTYFKGAKDGNYNELKWETASEKNNDFFTVEKTSKDGSSFDVVGTMNGAGTSNKSINYSLTDYNVEKTINYYRLKQTDFDGKSTFTDLISIDNTEKVSSKEIVMITNILGQEVNDDYRGLVIIAYSDGSSEKIIR